MKNGKYYKSVISLVCKGEITELKNKMYDYGYMAEELFPLTRFLAIF